MSEQDQKKVASMGLNAFWIFGKIEVSEEWNAEIVLLLLLFIYLFI
jgi:hypothetical protein